MSPTYNYKNKVSGDQVEVVQKITAEPFKKWKEIFEYKSGNSYVGSDGNDPVERVPNWEGTATIYGKGVYKQGTIAAATKKKDVLKSSTTRYSIKDIMKAQEEEDDE